ncbi:MAG TPA: [NiFe]-hydrogenase assembly chaperone HybE, partial [Rhodocyclaceae bacterium]|nr:[NiFe]-hydrogenase assembly chaperone HybE [Rhodocyclaceae bacterium]
ATPLDADPTAFLESHYRHVWETRMQDLPFVNPALGVAAVGFRRHRGDWLGVMVTPWFLNLFLISGGGDLWGDIPAGERRYVELPCGTLQFIADDDPELGPYQYCPLMAPVTHLENMIAALTAARDALAAAFTPPAEPQSAEETGAALPQSAPAEAPPSRRAFLRRLAGKR